jgi:predicted Fe-S protein YdhL (DUF1289 family)
MKISSPCTGVCELGGNEICTGCFRSKAEIAGWTQMNDREKSAVNAALSGRWKSFTAGRRRMETDEMNPCSSVSVRG